MFEEYSHRLRARYPQLSIEGENFPAHPVRRYLASAFGILKIGLIILIVSGSNPFPALNLDTPGFWTWAIENKVYSCLMLFFISNAIETQLLSTGAFEISLNDMPVWSKLESGKVPRYQELVNILENNMKLSYQL